MPRHRGELRAHSTGSRQAANSDLIAEALGEEPPKIGVGTDILILGSVDLIGAGGGGRTHTLLRVRDFESRASASSATPARNVNYNNFAGVTGVGFWVGRLWNSHSTATDSSRNTRTPCGSSVSAILPAANWMFELTSTARLIGRLPIAWRIAFICDRLGMPRFTLRASTSSTTPGRR